MPNIASVLKGEIARIARREIKVETEPLKKASAQYRATIAALKRQVLVLEKNVAKLTKAGGKQRRAGVAETNATRRVRYSAKRLAAHRAKLGLSAEAYGALVGVSGQSIYHWEAEKSRPRASQLQAIAAVRRLGKREAAARLEELSA
ncbi:helix-turn-helix transcriptional regulator [Ramlibacter sp. RBP-2]|uniref:Helix-turn-helix transcriptional regulator n=1 Tax=Ramlibacter lithotrophicus TaxID=2606681 RepID=A0A7X6DGR0_9BURK|nr:helix-turn-helix transcriptional regulator [Ramlibacter lithotrophicus]NKE66859.1 helix-turn-helix transcriptional regulator [Ramlibacter lithotrophicus]